MTEHHLDIDLRIDGGWTVPENAVVGNLWWERKRKVLFNPTLNHSLLLFDDTGGYREARYVPQRLYEFTQGLYVNLHLVQDPAGLSATSSAPLRDDGDDRATTTHQGHDEPAEGHTAAPTVFTDDEPGDPAPEGGPWYAGIGENIPAFKRYVISPEDTLDQAYEAAQGIWTQCREHGILRPNRKYDLIFLPLPAERFAALYAQPEYRERIDYLLHESWRTRVILMLSIQGAPELTASPWDRLCREGEYVVATGEHRIEELKELTGYDSHGYRTGRPIAGAQVTRHKNHVAIIQRPQLLRSKWSKQFKVYEEAKRRVQHGFLESLGGDE